MLKYRNCKRTKNVPLYGTDTKNKGKMQRKENRNPLI
nr:MAG TPA: hypothetical protein [Caudoviricetes sp.]